MLRFVFCLRVNKLQEEEEEKKEGKKQMVMYTIHLSATDKWQWKGSGEELRKGWLKIA